ncbi:cupin domain-containing protein [Pseudenhygromyxa sp. WMMC2535]|uniref:cupin domain-containing protein n=1 Tax=Pseudenhygromyxa sp. WMMC2535 TaxID=2712867 RepID=UPI001551E91D|nr:cupin domain-containing protein [Pseudenhygromyxa sp. WMMC2535]NVB43155.1 cupin domain-containing protein [Pseudenhygromyxa sp. WMMC2535]
MNDIRVKAIEEIEPYTGEYALPGIRFRYAGKALEVSAWGMNVIELDPNIDAYPEHDHASDGQEEVYVVLRGSARIVVGETSTTVHAGDMIRVGPSARRKFVTEDEGVSLLALGGTPGKAYTPSWGG